MLAFKTLGDVLQHRQKLNSFCRLVELKYQNLLSYELTALLRLNRPARRLQKQYARTQKAMRQALSLGDIATASVLKLRLIQIKKKQMLLRLKQQSVFQRVQSLNIRKQQQGPIRIRPYIHYELDLNFSSLKLAVKAKPPGAIAPVYEPKSFFRYRQRSRTRWRVPGLSIQGSCRATLFKENKRWKAVLLN